MTRRVFWTLALLAGTGCNCEEMLATKRTGAAPPVVVRPAEPQAQAVPEETPPPAQVQRPAPVAQVPLPPMPPRVPVVPPPMPVPAPAPEAPAKPPDDGPTANDAPPGEAPLMPAGGPPIRQLQPLHFPQGMAKSVFSRLNSPTFNPPAKVLDETKGKH